jgi:hypothetical protein
MLSNLKLDELANVEPLERMAELHTFQSVADGLAEVV